MNQSPSPAVLSPPSPTHAGLTPGSKLCFCAGDFGLNLYWQSISYFLLFYYTDVLGLEAATAGVIYMAASIFDGCVDPLAGMLMDRTRTRWGRYRPWIALGAVPLALSFMLMYWQPPATGLALVTWVVVGHLLFRVGYTLVAVPYASLTARLTTDSRVRASLVGMRMLFATAAATAVGLGTQPLVAWFGQGDAAAGFFRTALLVGVCATLIFFVVVAFVREPADEREDGHGPRPGLWAALVATGHNPAFMALVAGLLFATLSTTAISKSLLYYFKYVVGDPQAARYALMITTFSAFALVPLWTIVARRIGKRALWLLGVGLGLAGLAGLAALRPNGIWGATLFFGVMQCSISANAVAYWSMLPDTVEYGEWKTGVRLESFLFGAFMFVQKLGFGLAAGLFGWALSLAGYGAGAGHATTNGQALPLIVLVLSGAGLAGCGIAVFLSPLRLGVHERVCRALAGR
jgi:GPH family glycoside/pentoside/hexuronide:cation symporter